MSECVLLPSFEHPKCQHGVFALALNRVSDAFQVPVECSWTIQINQIADIYASAFARLYNTYKPQKKVTASKNSRHLAVTKSQFPVVMCPTAALAQDGIVNWKCAMPLWTGSMSDNWVLITCDITIPLLNWLQSGLHA